MIFVWLKRLLARNESKRIASSLANTRAIVTSNVNPEHCIEMPTDAGRAIVESGALFIQPLLRGSAFVAYCNERGMKVTEERLILLERLGIFGPVFRVKNPGDTIAPFRFPVGLGENWFEKGWAWDTAVPGKGYNVPSASDRSEQGYYSIFQIDELGAALSRLTIHVELDWYLEAERTGQAIDWRSRGDAWMALPRSIKGPMSSLRATAFLCQLISERYYPHTQSDGRRMQVGRSGYSDSFLVASNKEKWPDFAHAWNPAIATARYGLSKANLRNMYESIAVSQAMRDPLENWYQLVHFVAVDLKERLKGDALRAETTRSGALMLRMLYRDLFGEELPIPNEVAGQIIVHQPELEVRKDTRRFLEFVANRFHVNPQPLVALFVEGETEKHAIELIFERYACAHPGKYGIEIIALGGVDNATGGKEDRFRAIFRLIDYLHHHQTLTYLLLDNENFARKLEMEARTATSIHTADRLVTNPDHIQLCERSFEFDNFEVEELARALTTVASGSASFTADELEQCKAQSEPGAALKKLFRSRAGKNPDKMKLIELLVDAMLDPSSPIKVIDRPIVKTLDKIADLATRNPLPTRQEYWESNQRSQFFGFSQTSMRMPKRNTS